MNWQEYKEKIGLVLLILVHFGMGVFSYYYSITTHKTDFYVFYNIASSESLSREVGTSFFIYLNSFIIKLGAPFWLMYLLYTTISFIPFYFFYKKLTSELFGDYIFLKFMTCMLLYLPSIHFWLASFSKDSLCFFLIFIASHLLLARISFSKIILIIPVLALLLCIRPYLVFILLFSYVIYLFINNVLILNRYFLLLLLLFFTISLIVFIDFIKFDLSQVSSLLEYIQSKYETLYQRSKIDGNAIINLKNTNVLERFFLMMFRPFFFDANNIFQFIISLENLTLLLSFSFLFLKINILSFLNNKKNIFYLVFAITLWLFYSLYIYNYGLASRMKATILPFLFYYICLTLIKIPKYVQKSY